MPQPSNRQRNLLLLDIGNTSLKWARDEEVKSNQFKRLSHAEVQTALPDQWRELKKPSRVLIAQVGDTETLRWVTAWIKQQWDLEPELLVSEAQAESVVNGYADPAQLGVDRWLALTAARKLSEKSLCVVDAGSAITIDLLPRDGHHLGGYIAPGLRLMQQSLTEGAALPPPKSEDKGACVGQDTNGAINGGLLMAASGFIERTLIEWQTRLRAEPELILTGGDAERLEKILCYPVRVEPALVFQGMLLQARRPKPKKDSEKGQ